MDSIISEFISLKQTNVDLKSIIVSHSAKFLHLENQINQINSEIKKLKTTEKVNNETAKPSKSSRIKDFISEFYGDTKVSITEAKQINDVQNCRTNDASNNRLIDRLNFEPQRSREATKFKGRFERPLPVDSKADIFASLENDQFSNFQENDFFDPFQPFPSQTGQNKSNVHYDESIGKLPVFKIKQDDYLEDNDDFDQNDLNEGFPYSDMKENNISLKLRADSKETSENEPKRRPNRVVIKTSEGDRINLDDLRSTNYEAFKSNLKPKKEDEPENVLIVGKKFKCNFCEKEYNAFSDLQAHIKKHEEQKNSQNRVPNLKSETNTGAPAESNGRKEWKDSSSNDLPKPPVSNKDKEDSTTNNAKLPLLIPPTKPPYQVAPYVRNVRKKYNIKPKTVHRCAACAFKTKSKEKFDHHVETMCPTQIPLCTFCQTEFPSKDLMKLHIETTHKANFHSCDQCVFTTKHYYHLNSHIKFRHKREFDFQCDKCLLVTTTKTKLKNHIRWVHDKIREFQCAECAGFYSTKYNLDLHMKTVHWGIKLYQCPACHYRTNQKGYLKAHYTRDHEGELDVDSIEVFKANQNLPLDIGNLEADQNLPLDIGNLEMIDGNSNIIDNIQQEDAGQDELVEDEAANQQLS